jgi:hypothetical protein
MDMTYREALEQLAEPREVLLGPAPCQRCGAWVEWAGVRWLALGTDEAHECTPYLHPGEEPEVVASWVRPPVPPYQQAHQPAPAWLGYLGAGIMWLGATLAVGFAVLLVVRYVLR